jgi:hypothetical protein
MQRRNLLKFMALSPIMFNGKQAGAHVPFKERRKYVIFVNTNVIREGASLDKFAEGFKGMREKGIDVSICPVSVPEGQTFDNAIRILELDQD